MKDNKANKNRVTILPSQEELNRLLICPRCDFQTNKSHAVWNARYAGKPALASVSKHGYLVGHLMGYVVKSHRVIWKMMTGFDAEVIDHDDGVKTNNVWINLKSGSDADNMKNKKLYSSNKSGVIGVYWHSGNEKWHASIKSNGVKTHLGFYNTLEQAAAARAKAEADLGFNRNHGREAI